MNKAKVVSSPLATHFRLSTNQSPSIDQEKEEIEKVSYASTVRSLMYVMVCTCLDIAYVIGTISRFLSNPRKEHQNVVKSIIRYFWGTSSMSLCFGCEKLEFIGLIDANMAEDIDSCR